LGRIRPASCVRLGFGDGVPVADGRAVAVVDRAAALGDPLRWASRTRTGRSPGRWRRARPPHARPGTARRNRQPPPAWPPTRRSRSRGATGRADTEGAYQCSPSTMPADPTTYSGPADRKGCSLHRQNSGACGAGRRATESGSAPVGSCPVFAGPVAAIPGTARPTRGGRTSRMRVPKPRNACGGCLLTLVRLPGAPPAPLVPAFLLWQGPTTSNFFARRQ
jgi:hypothetical protein